MEGAVRLNRFGLERGKTWQAILLLIGILAPMLWVPWNHAVSGEEELAPGEKIVLSAIPPPMAPPGIGTVELTIPNEGWTADAGDTTAEEVTLVHSPMVAEITAVAGVTDIEVLFDRKKREIDDGEPTLFTSEVREYTTDGGLEGVWGQLTGERYGGALVVVGKGSVAAVVEVTAPLGRMDEEMDDVALLLDSLRVSS